MKNYYISGMFYQLKPSFGIGFDPNIGERAMMVESILPVNFFGSYNTMSSQGLIVDKYGEALIYIKEFTSNKIIFTKTYLRKKDSFEYILHKTEKEERWYGTWKHEDSPDKFNGLVWLILVDVGQNEPENPLPMVDALSKIYKESEIPLLNEMRKFIKNSEIFNKEMQNLWDNQQYDSISNSGDDLPF